MQEIISKNIIHCQLSLTQGKKCPEVVEEIELLTTLLISLISQCVTL